MPDRRWSGRSTPPEGAAGGRSRVPIVLPRSAAPAPRAAGVARPSTHRSASLDRVSWQQRRRFRQRERSSSVSARPGRHAWAGPRTSSRDARSTGRPSGRAAGDSPGACRGGLTAGPGGAAGRCDACCASATPRPRMRRPTGACTRTRHLCRRRHGRANPRRCSRCAGQHHAAAEDLVTRASPTYLPSLVTAFLPICLLRTSDTPSCAPGTAPRSVPSRLVPFRGRGGRAGEPGSR
jgi:hypothetical protein